MNHYGNERGKQAMTRSAAPNDGSGFGSRPGRSESKAVDWLSHEHRGERSCDAEVQALESLAVHG